MSSSYTKHTIIILAFCFGFGFFSQIYGQFSVFAESYSTLSTIAGKGELDDRSVVGWKADYEGGLATDAELTRPHFAMADSAGNIYIADKDAHGIRKITADGKIFTIAGTNIAGYNGDGIASECQLNSPNGLWVKYDGTVYVLDLGNSKIRRINTDGSLETIVDDASGISLGRGIWVTPNEDSIFYASGSRVKLWTRVNGITDYSIGYSDLGNICMDKDGYLVTTDRNTHTAYRISKDGSTKSIIAGNGSRSGGGDGQLATETGLNEVRAVWFLDDNSFFLGTHEGSQIWYVDISGRIHLFLDGRNGDEYHTGDGENYRTPGYKISEVRSVTVDYNGNVLITENDKGYVRKIQNDYTYYYTNLIRNQNNDIKSITVFPNPAQNSIHISPEINKAGTATLIIRNNIGEIVQSTSLEYSSIGKHTSAIDITNLKSGLYFCTFAINSSTTTNKLMILKP